MAYRSNKDVLTFKYDNYILTYRYKNIKPNFSERRSEDKGLVITTSTLAKSSECSLRIQRLNLSPLYKEVCTKKNLEAHEKEMLIKLAEYSSLNKEITYSCIVSIIDYFKALPKNINLDLLKETELISLMTSGDIRLSNIPVYKITYDICLASCKINGGDLKYVPNKFYSVELFKAALNQSPWLYKTLPDQFKTIELREFAVAKGGSLIDILPETMRTLTLYEATCKEYSEGIKLVPLNHPNRDMLLDISLKVFGTTLEYLNEKEKTYDRCLLACKTNGAALEFVPEQFKNFKICNEACKSNYKILLSLPKNIPNSRLTELYESSCMNSPEALLIIPETHRTYELYELAFRHIWLYDVNFLRDKEITCRTAIFTTQQKAELYKTACKVSGRYIRFVPQDLITEGLCDIAIESDMYAYKYIPEKFKEKYKKDHHLFDDFNSYFERLMGKKRFMINNHISFLTKKMQLEFLCDPKILLNEKLKLINFIENPEKHLIPIQMRKSITSNYSPLFSELYNPYVYELINNIHVYSHFSPPKLKHGQQIDNIVSKEISFETIKANDLLTGTKRIEVVGGRTIKINSTPGEDIYYKFQRKDESLSDFVREGQLYQLFDSSKDILNKFKSILPKHEKFIKLKECDNCSDLINSFNDKVEIIHEKDGKYINVFSYSAKSEYCKYSHILDFGAENPYLRPENSIKKACHDAGVMASMGLILTSVLPAFHDTGEQRQWMALNALITADYSSFPYPGTFGAWNTDATENPDFGCTGIRDLGDYELFGKLQHYLQYKDASETIFINNVKQRILFCNAISEILLGAILIRSRLRQQLPDYHYKNKKSVNETVKFIEEIFTEFITGYLGINGSSFSLWKFFQIEVDEYNKWLEKTALEVVYWTALQPFEQSAEFHNNSEHDHADCYLNHIANNRSLSLDVYPSGCIANLNENQFFNINNKLNLGANNKTFPLINLMNGLFRMCTCIVKT